MRNLWIITLILTTVFRVQNAAAAPALNARNAIVSASEILIDAISNELGMDSIIFKIEVSRDSKSSETSSSYDVNAQAYKNPGNEYMNEYMLLCHARLYVYVSPLRKRSEEIVLRNYGQKQLVARLHHAKCFPSR